MIIFLGILAALLLGVAAAYMPLVVLGVAGACVAAYLVWWLLDRPRALIGLILLVIVAGQIGRIPPLSGDILLIDGLVGLLFVGEVLRRLWLPIKTKLQSIHMVWLAFLGVALVSLILTTITVSKTELLKNSLYWVRLVMYSSLLWIIPEVVRTKTDAKQIVSWISGAGILLAVIGFIQLAVYPDIGPLAKYGWDPHVGRLVSTFLDPNYLGGFFALVLALMLGQSLVGNMNKKLPWILILFVLVASVLTYSRSGYIAVGVVVILFGLKYSWKFLVAALLCVSLLAFAIPRVRNRVIGGFSLDTTSQDRIKSWKNAVVVIGNYPVLGVGYNNYREAQEELHILQGGVQSHAAAGSDSSLLNVQATTGFFGFGLFLATLVLIARRIRELTRYAEGVQKGVALALLFGGPALIFHSFFVNSLFYPFIFFPLMVLLGLLFVEYDAE